jgi:AraC-like DNA-binding protein
MKSHKGMVIMGIKAALKCSNQSVQQISEEFNFLNPSFFGTFFKRRTGITPLQYRNM